MGALKCIQAEVGRRGVDLKILLACLASLSNQTFAQIMIGQSVAVDGDTIRFGDEVIRLFGIDAPELGQTCNRNGEVWPCGAEAKEALAQRLAAGRLDCSPRDIDRYGRIVAVCAVAGQDLAQGMAETGYAIALFDFTSDYVAAESAAKAARLGLWAGTFEIPAVYRVAHPTMPGNEYRPDARRALPVVSSARSSSSTYYPSCRAAWIAGAAPIHRGQPGYRVELDGDLDGVACEPFRKRTP